jgi:hypothetical protein
MSGNRRTLTLASSLAAVPLVMMLVAILLHKRRRKSSGTSGFLPQTTSLKQGANTMTGIDGQGLKEKSQRQQSMPGQESKIMNVMATINTIDNSKDATHAAMPLLTVSPSAFDNTVIDSSSSSSSTTTTTQTPKEQEVSISDDARKAGESLKELIVTAIKDAKDSAKGTGKRLKEETIGNAATADSKDIQSIGDTLNALVGLFEKTMTEIRKENYNDQIELLQSYKDLLKTQVKVVKARGTMARKLKPGA